MPVRHIGIYALFLVSFLAISFGVQSDFSGILGFDEPIYLAAARWPAKIALFDGHPPLGKWIYSLAPRDIETSVAWYRAITLVWGTGVVILLMVLLSRLTTSRYVVAASCAGILVGQFAWVYSNLVSLEIFTAFFAILAFLLVLSEDSSSIVARDIAAGLCVGAAMAIKWSCATIGITAIGIIIFGQTNGATQSALFRALRITGCAVACYVVLFVALSVAPLSDLLLAHQALYRHLQESTGTFDFQSPMWMWPFGYRPVTILRSEQREVVLRGCVWMNVLGLWAVIDTLLFWRSRDRARRVLAIAFFAMWLPWSVVPRDTQFIYYFFMSSIFLTIAAAMWVAERQRVIQVICAMGLVCNGVWNVLTYLRVV